MTRLLPVLSVALALAALLPSAALASERRPTLGELEREVMCPVCDTTLDQSDSPAARQVRVIIVQRIRAGDTKSEIKSHLVREFGPAILAAPPRRGFDLLAWWLPLAGLALGAAALGVLVWRWSRAPVGPVLAVGADGGTLLPDLEKRVDEELRRFEA